jgi:hypothetical protein
MLDSRSLAGSTRKHQAMKEMGPVSSSLYLLGSFMSLWSRRRATRFPSPYHQALRRQFCVHCQTGNARCPCRPAARGPPSLRRWVWPHGRDTRKCGGYPADVRSARRRRRHAHTRRHLASPLPRGTRNWSRGCNSCRGRTARAGPLACQVAPVPIFKFLFRPLLLLTPPPPPSFSPTRSAGRTIVE